VEIIWKTKVSVGVVTDVAMMGAEPKHLTCSFIIEEGFLLRDLEKICPLNEKRA